MRILAKSAKTNRALIGNDSVFFLVEDIDRIVRLDLLLARMKRDADERRLPAAYAWDDLFISLDKADVPKFSRFHWSTRDPLPLSQFSSAGRCAIRLEGRVVPGDESTWKVTETSGSLARLPVETVAYEKAVFRFTGWGEVRALAKARPRPSTRAKKISVILNFRDRSDLTTASLHSVKTQRVNSELEIVLVNNQSTAEERRKTVSFAEATFGKNAVITVDYDKPFNHSAQCNLAVSQASGDVIFMLNNDCKLTDTGALQELADWAASGEYATVGPRILGDKAKLVSSGVQVHRVPSDEIAQGYGIKECAIDPLSEAVRLTAGNSFACAAIPRTAWEALGGLDETEFSTQFNDADFFLRALDKGYRHLYLGHVTAYHQPGQSSTDKSKDRIRSLRRKLVERNGDLGRWLESSPGTEAVNYGEIASGMKGGSLVASMMTCRLFGRVSPKFAAKAAKLAPPLSTGPRPLESLAN